MDTDIKSGPMAQGTKANGKMIKLMAKGNSFMLTVMSMRDNG